jgi:hypothetical protein
MTKMGNAVTTNTKATRQELPFVSSRALLHVAPGASIAMAGNRMARRTTMMTTVMARTKAGMLTTPATGPGKQLQPAYRLGLRFGQKPCVRHVSNPSTQGRMFAHQPPIM